MANSITATMAPSIENWPPETFEALCTFLPLSDLCALRLVSKSVAELVAQDTFKSYYRVKHLDVAPESLSTFAQITASPDSLAHEVQELVLCGVAVSTTELERIAKERARWVSEGGAGPIFASTQHKLSDDEVTKAEADLQALKERDRQLAAFLEEGMAGELLAEAFGNLAKYAESGGLKVLRLEVVVLKEGLSIRQKPIETRSKDVVWEAAEKAFGSVVAGLAGSGMVVKEFDLFSGQWHCSLRAGALACVDRFSEEDMKRALGRLATLSLSLSADPRAKKDKLDDETDESAARVEHHDENCLELSRILGLCPNLESLDLHWFKLRSAAREDWSTERLLEPVAQQPVTPNLRRLALRGVQCKDLTLLDILKNASIEALQIQNVSLDRKNPIVDDNVGGDNDDDYDDDDDEYSHRTPTSASKDQWQGIFDYLTRPATTLTSLDFDDLWGHRLLHFKNSARGEKFPWTGPTEGGPTLERKGEEEIRRKIEATYPGGRPLGSPWAYRWRVQREREYGPA